MSLDTASQNHSGSAIDLTCSASSEANPCFAMNRPIRARAATSAVGRQMISIGVSVIAVSPLGKSYPLCVGRCPASTWRHGIPPTKALRYAVTFRDLQPQLSRR